jgi:regulator of sigma E protease
MFNLFAVAPGFDIIKFLTDPVGFLITLVILSILVLIHEAGHYFTAKWFGIKVEEFGFGLPPRAWGKKVGETIYSINWLPIGGFVKLFGEDDAGGGKVTLKEKAHEEHHTKEELKRAFFARPAWQRAIVVFAGVLMNALLAFAIYYLFMFLSDFKTLLPLYNDHTFFGVSQTNKLDGLIVGRVAKNSPAQKAGIKDCSEKYCAKIVAADGTSFKSSQEFLDVVKKKAGKTIQLTIEEMNSKKRIVVSVIPRVNPPKGEGAVGVELSGLDTAVLEYKTPTQKLFSGIIHPLNLMVYNYDLIKMLIQRSVVDKDFGPVSQSVSGPIGIFSLGGAINHIPGFKEKLIEYLNLAGLLSISLAIFNVLPIPALDGGRLFFILIELIFRKKVSPAFENKAHTIGMAVLIGLILLVTFKDVLQLFHL